MSLGTVRYFVGADIGQVSDPTAIAVIRESKPRGRDASFHLVHLDRFELGQSYPAQIERIRAIISRPPLSISSTKLAVDATGVGRAVSDLMNEKRLNHTAISITAGDNVSEENRRIRVGKSLLVGRLLTSLHDLKLQISPDIPHADRLRKELQDFRVAFTPAGNAVFNAREGQHDDLVLAVALAHWIAVPARGGKASRRFNNGLTYARR